MKKKQLAIVLSVIVGIGVVYAFVRFGFGIELSSFFAADTSVTSPVNKVLPPNYQGSYTMKSTCAPVSNTFYWSLQPGAIYNRIEREINGNGVWTLIGSFAPANTSFTDIYCANGSTCRYRHKSSDTIMSRISICAPVYTPSVLTPVCAPTPTGNALSWNVQAYANYNRIEREINGNGVWTLIGNFAPAITSFTDIYCGNGSTCKYRYRASDTFFSNVATCAPVYTSTVLTAVCAQNSNALSWNVQAYANYNRIEREINGNGVWTLIGNFAPAITSFTDIYCGNGSTCKYRYRASDTFFSNEVRCPIPLP